MTHKIGVIVFHVDLLNYPKGHNDFVGQFDPFITPNVAVRALSHLTYYLTTKVKMT